MNDIPQSTIQSIKDATDAHSLVSEYIHLRKSGSGYVGLCPFHNEDTPSFRVHVSGERRGQCICFGCDFKGGVITFLMCIEGIPFPVAARRLADRAGITIEDSKPRSAIQRAADAEDTEFCAWWWQQRWDAARAELDEVFPTVEFPAVEITWVDGVMQTRALGPVPASYRRADALGRRLREIEGIGLTDKRLVFEAQRTGAERRAFRAERDEGRRFDRMLLEVAAKGEVEFEWLLGTLGMVSRGVWMEGLAA